MGSVSIYERAVAAMGEDFMMNGTICTQNEVGNAQTISLYSLHRPEIIKILMVT
jgi:hypothetical protein